MTPDMFAPEPGAPKELRPHQAVAIGLLKRSTGKAIHEGRRARFMLKLSTGAGKTVIAAAIVQGARTKGKRVLFIVDAISLIDQTVEAFMSQGVTEIGVIQAQHSMEDWSRPVQVASVQTLQRRGKLPPADIVIVDEAHCQSEWLSEIMQSETWAGVPFIGLSATPWSKGLGLLYDELICPITMQELIDRELLCPFRVYAAAHPDLTGVKTTAGDYQQAQLSEAMAAGNLVADLVETWRRYGENRPTFCFAVDRAHAKKIQRRFEEAGIGCGYIDAFTPTDERKDIRRQLDAGQIRVVCNVGCLTKGVDWAIGCIILARPTKSEMLYVQMVGRGLRVNEGIPDCVILDHADNTLRMGFVTDLDATRNTMCTAKRGERTARERPVPLPKECGSCGYLKPPKTRECPSCGFVGEPQSKVTETNDELVPVSRKQAAATRDQKQAWLSQLNWIARERGYSRGWAANTYKKKFGVYPRNLDASATCEPSHEVRSYVRSSLIAFAKRRDRAA
ncbi:DEAD/DEAH box helicase [Sphingomonas sp. ACRSK]|uniref:DEAD/DEAH box helicase n=1 Tax=Sphingomonas sp. ACRSK TaxID=2918213 RepID=UPI00315948C1